MVGDEYTHRVELVMDYVRTHRNDDLKLGQLARVAQFSPYHFHRIFKAVARETVADFTRRSRLERAAHLLKAAPNKSLGSIAMDSGFGSHSDFSRVFRSTYGMPPSEWNRVTPLVAQESDGAEAASLGPRRYGVSDPPLRVEVRDHPEATIAYVRMRDPFRRGLLEAGYEKLTKRLTALGIDWTSSQLFGMSWDHYDATEISQVHFDLGFAVPSDFDGDGSVGVIRIPRIRSADVHSCGPMLRIAQAWDVLYLDWFPDSEYEPADLPAIKRFRRRPDEVGWRDWDVDCCIAIQPLRR